MSFFSNLSKIIGESYSITITVQIKGDKMSVSVLPKALDSKSELSKNTFRPITVTGSPDQIDAGLLAAIANPLRAVNELVVSSNSFVQEKKPASKTTNKSKTEKPKETKKLEEKSVEEPKVEDQIGLDFDQDTGEIFNQTQDPELQAETEQEPEESFDESVEEDIPESEPDQSDLKQPPDEVKEAEEEEDPMPSEDLDSVESSDDLMLNEEDWS